MASRFASLCFSKSMIHRICHEVKFKADWSAEVFGKICSPPSFLCLFSFSSSCLCLPNRGKNNLENIKKITNNCQKIHQNPLKSEPQAPPGAPRVRYFDTWAASGTNLCYNKIFYRFWCTLGRDLEGHLEALESLWEPSGATWAHFL